MRETDAAHRGIDVRGGSLVVTAAICYAMTVVFAKGAYAAGLDVSSLLFWRFLFATVLFWLWVALRRPKPLRPKEARVAVGLGLVGYAGQALFYFGAIAAMDAGLAALVLYAYPAIVTVIALLTRHESPTRRRLFALASSAFGLVLLLGLGASGQASPTGVTLALLGALTYAVYTLVASQLPADADPVLVMAIVSSAALVSLTTYAFAVADGVGVGTTPVAGLGWALAHATIGTVLAMSVHQMGLVSVGAPTAGILSSIEPVVAATFGAVLWHERLSPGQLLGALFVLASVVILSLPARTRAGSRARGGDGGIGREFPSAAAAADHGVVPGSEPAGD